MAEREPPISRVVPDLDNPASVFTPLPPRPKSEQPTRTRLARSKAPFVRFQLSWFVDHRLFPPHLRLLSVLLYRSREGREPVRLTAEVAKEAGINPPKRWQYARSLEQLGVVRISRDEQPSLILTVLLRIEG